MTAHPVRRWARAWLAPLLLLLLAVAPASAGTRNGVTLPDHVRAGSQALVLNGMGVREATFMKVDVYVAGLYLEKRSSDARAIIASNQVKRLVLHFVREVERDDITEAWEEGFEKNATDSQRAKLKSRINRLNEWMAGMAEGQELTFTYVPDQGITVTVKGKDRGTIPGADFAKVFFSIWLGPHPPNAGLKEGLLGKK